MKQTAYPYQANAIPLLRKSLSRGKRRPVIVGPCGCGKTTVIALIAEQIVNKGGTAIIRSFRRRLIEQLSERLRLNGVEYGVLMADLPNAEWARYRPSAAIQVASSQTLMARADKEGVPNAEWLIDDEIQAMTGAEHIKLRDLISPKYNVGLTATPCQPDGSGFPSIVADDLIELCKIQDLLTPSELAPEQRLVPVETYEPVGEGRKRRKGLASGVAGDPVRQWINHAAGMRTLVFSNSIKECNAVKKMYLADSIPAVHINADTPIEERDEAFAKLQSREIMAIVCTPSLMGVGVDLPFLECVQSLVMHAAPQSHWQAIGRAQRKAPGKEKAIWLNHSASNHVHGSPNVSPDWKLGVRDSIQRREMERRATCPADFTPSVCPSCGLRSFGVGACPKCGTVSKSNRTADGIGTVRESLTRTAHDNADVAGPDTMAAQADWRKMMYSAAYQGLTCKALSARFKSRYGVYPKSLGVSPVPEFEQGDMKVGDWNPDLLRNRKRSVA